MDSECCICVCICMHMDVHLAIIIKEVIKLRGTWEELEGEEYGVEIM